MGWRHRKVNETSFGGWNAEATNQRTAMPNPRRRLYEWDVNRQFKAKIRRPDGKIRSKVDSWTNLCVWLSTHRLPPKSVRYSPSFVYRLNPKTGRRRLKVLTIQAGPNRYHFYETEPNGVNISERFECYQVFHGVEMFVDSDAMLPALMLYMVDSMREYEPRLDFAINNWVMEHYNNLVKFRDVAMSFIEGMYEEIATHVPALPPAPYDLAM